MRIFDTIRQESTRRVHADTHARRGVVVTCPRAAEAGAVARTHEHATRELIAQKLAALKGYEYAGEHDAAAGYEGKVYLVPAETLLGDAAHAMGVRTEHDLFGGVVPYAFAGTKSITHPLADAAATRPPGWSEAYSQHVRGAVLHGVAAFSHEDAQRGGERLLARGAVRVKPSTALGGLGQTLVHDRHALRAALAALDPQELAACGVVVEQNLTDVVTYSVGRVHVGDLLATYFGTQKLVADHRGEMVYGGSQLTVARGDFEALLALDVDAGTRRAIEQARIYNAAADACFPGFFASRRNYDIAAGRDAQGDERCGVLEQSWRLGGASGAEIAALEAFHADPALAVVHAESTELYGEDEPVPAGATVYFRGVDPKAGFITKYTTFSAHVDA